MRNYLGVVKVVIVFVLIISVISSCEKEDNMSYEISIRNSYFETIDSVTIGDTLYGEIKTNEISNPNIFNKGQYTFEAHSVSGLIFKSTIYIQGDRYNLLLVFSDDGKLLIDK